MEGLADQDCSPRMEWQPMDWLGVRDWQMAVLDKVGWQSILKEAMIP